MPAILRDIQAMAQASQAHFREVQRFREWRLWFLLMLLTLAPVPLFGWGLVQQLVYDHPWGDRPMSDIALALTSSIAMLVCLAVAWLLWTMDLTTEVRADGLHVRLFPFPRKQWRFDEIESAEARTYKPLREYGGWGWKLGPSGTAYNVRGDRGVQLTLRGGKRVLIGSQRADELARVLQRRI